MTNQSAHLKVPNGRVNTSMEKSDTELNVCPSPSSVFLDPDTTKAASSTPSLTDFLDVRTLQEIQNNFSVLTHLHTMIRNADGQPITVSTDIAHRDESNQILEQLIETDQTAGHPYLAPIIVNGQRLGSITIERKLDIPVTEASSNLRRLATKMDIDLNQTEKLILAAQTDARQAQPPNADDIQSLVLLANNISLTRLEQRSQAFTKGRWFNGSPNANNASLLARLASSLATRRGNQLRFFVRRSVGTAAAGRASATSPTQVSPKIICSMMRSFIVLL